MCDYCLGDRKEHLKRKIRRELEEGAYLPGVVEREFMDAPRSHQRHVAEVLYEIGVEHGRRRDPA